MFHVKKNRYGFYELKNKPSTKELKEYYANKYYQEASGSYDKYYSNQEIIFINNKIAQRYAVIKDLLDVSTLPDLNFLDIGCGEGWALKFFKEKTWNVFGLDYSHYGCKSHNPDFLDYLETGDIYINIDRLIQRKQKFDCIWLDNVLEHVLDPFLLLQKCAVLANKQAVLVIDVPNDYSCVQNHLLEKGYISKPFWVVVPDHISYFNKEGLINICSEAGWCCNYMMSDYPIDFNLFNKSANYIKDREKGKDCHEARIEIENLLHDTSVKKTNELYRVLAELGMGRSIIGFFKLSSKQERGIIYHDRN